ncbi:Spermidine/putrescine import ATP-binding protein PotA [bacterium HR12]|nr:Spermidine/putrescine import ATP-binding protein PotA [bacterium HR12]
MTEVAISLIEVTKRFGDVVAVNRVSLDVYAGEFLTLLGPSGCGKTTTMRMIAGFEDPDEGRILLQGRDIVGVPPNRRPVNMVFQAYALFPHMTVEQNVGYGLRLRKVPREERRRRVAEMLEIVGLAGFERRKPSQLSGGQQQRVALARALVNRPAALLLDEPLGALDVKLRKHMQLELKRIQHELGTTFLYVTHDQDEALSMSDRIAVMNQGSIEQVGDPRTIYERPETPFVADFVGVLNALEVRVDELADGVAEMRLADGQRVRVPLEPDHRPGDRLIVAVRPERVRLTRGTRGDAASGSVLGGVVERLVYLGTLTQVHVRTSLGARLIVHELSGERTAGLVPGEAVTLAWEVEDAAVLRRTDEALAYEAEGSAGPTR